VLVWYWGRRGAGPRYTLEIVRALRRDPGLQLYLSLSRQSDLFGAFEPLELPAFHVDTYRGFPSFLGATLRIGSVRRRFREFLERERIELVYNTMSHLWNPFAVSAIHRSGARYLFTVHDVAPHPGDDAWVRARLLRREILAADGWIALTETSKERLLTTYGCPSSRVAVIPLGALSYGSRPTAARRLPEHGPRLLFFGRILPYKGLDLLLEAYRIVKAQCPGSALIIAGQGNLDAFAGQLCGLADVSTENRWIAEEEIGEFFEQADIVVLPYTEASQSGVVAVAFSKGIPTVATPVGGLRDQVRDGVTGVLASDVTPEALARAILRLATDQELYRTVSAGALAHARGELSWHRIGGRVAGVIREMSRGA
jgi:glycosyltransferase involved in cell wall biosynthesis